MIKRLFLIVLIALGTLSAQAQYGILVNGKDVYLGEYTDSFEGFTQYLVHAYIHSGDYCQLYDSGTKAAWANTLNAASVSAFTRQNDRYVCSADGCYDFYIKLKFGQDELYIGPGSDCSSGPEDPETPSTDTEDFATAVPGECEDVMLQAFYWNSYTDQTYGGTKWSQLKANAEEIVRNFDLVWLPPSSQTNDQMGYLPKIYSNQNCSWGLRAELKQLIQTFHEGGTRVIADVVINHAANKSTWIDFMDQDFGEYGSFSPQSTWITSDDEAKGQGTLGSNADDGQSNDRNFGSARDWDHKNPQVQAMCKAYLKWLKGYMNYDGYRFDYAGGFHVSHINDYVSEAKPYFSVMEYWDGNAAVLKQRIDQAGKNTLTFDFANFYNMQKGIAKDAYSYCLHSGLRGQGYSKYAVLFVDNHDTFNRDIHADVGGSKDGKTTIANRDLILQCNAYILSMPCVPCVFYPHWYTYKPEINAMSHARTSAGSHSARSVAEQNGSGWYKATSHGKAGAVVLYLGSAASEAAPSGFKQAIKEGKVAMYYTGDETRGVENVQRDDVQCTKELRDGRLLIRKGGKTYDAQGRLIIDD